VVQHAIGLTAADSFPHGMTLFAALAHKLIARALVIYRDQPGVLDFEAPLVGNAQPGVAPVSAGGSVQPLGRAWAMGRQERKVISS
jgi:hypothetical protein